MKIVFMGTPQFSVPILEALIEKYEVVLVVTQPDKITGRKNLLTESEVKKTAKQHNIPVFQPSKIKEDYQTILDYKPDIIITAAYGQIIPKELLDYPKYGCINVHASLLPKYRGGAPIQRAIMNGERYSGITIMYMDEKMDAGNIISQQRLGIGLDNASQLNERLSIIGRNLLIKTLPNIISNNINPIKQDIEKVSYAPVISKEDEIIKWNKPYREVYDQIRALADKPGAYTVHKGKKIKILDCRFEIDGPAGQIGEIVENKKQVGIRVQNGIIYLYTVQLEGKNKMSIKDFLNGYPNYFELGDILK